MATSAIAATVIAVFVSQPAQGAQVATWHLDENAGATRMLDSNGDHDGRITGSVESGLRRAVAGRAYRFRGHDPLIRVPSSPDLNPHRAALRITAYLSVPADLTTGDYNVIEKGTETATGGAYKLEIVGTRTPRFGYPSCVFNSSGKTRRVTNRVYGPKRINDGRWHRVRCVLTRTRAFVRVDGVAGDPVHRTVGSIANSTDLTLGGKPNDTHHFRGRMDEVSVSIR
jgi:hypothetical protein